MQPMTVVLRWLPLTAVLLVAACSSPPPPLPPVLEVEPPEPVEPEVPPLPKCESLDEECKAEEGTRLGIAGTTYDFTPPAGWTYAILERATVAQVDAGNAVIALTSIVPEKDKKKLSGQRVDATKELLELTSIAPKNTPKLTRYSRKKREFSGLKMSVWQYDSATRGEGTGYLMVLTGAAGDHDLVGITYAPADHPDAVQAVLAALDTLAEAEATGDEGDEGTKDAEDNPKDAEGGEEEKKGDSR
jgi:hypothetical protein